jgi:hypothetical protein
MRNLVIDMFRHREAIKRGGGFEITTLETSTPALVVDASDLQSLGDAIDALSKHDPELAQLVDLEFFCGFSFVEIAHMREVSDRTVQRDWEKARLLLRRLIDGEDVLTHATISYDPKGCPSSIAPTPRTTTGSVVTGLVHITGNGQPAPFEMSPGTTQLTPSPLTICVTGGANVEFANITLVLEAPAAKHFGTQAIHGVVVECNRAWARESGDCAVQE